MREERGPIDEEALGTVDRIFRKRLKDLVAEIEYVPSVIEPIELQISLYVGFHSDTSRFDVQWWLNHGYKYHYIEDEIEFRFGWEKRPGYPEKHFHPPEDLTEHRESCIRHEETALVTLAVLKSWWDALLADNPSLLNGQDDPP